MPTKNVKHIPAAARFERRTPAAFRLRANLSGCLLAGLLLIGACDLRGAGTLAPVLVETRSLVANGVSGGALRFVPDADAGPGAKDRKLVVVGPAGDSASIEVLKREPGRGGGETVHFRSTGRAGRALFYTNHGSVAVLQFRRADQADSDGDGFPDAVELSTTADRAAFRAWFLRIADSQYLKPSHAWNQGERDCSGLIRFAYREALKRHDARWQRRSGIVLDKNLPDVERYNYPEVPVLGERIFRVASGSASILDDFADFASAEFLARLNTRRISGEVEAAVAGDLLFFWNPRDAEMPFHSMIVADAAPGEGGDNDEMMILYHTGGEAGIKRVPVAYLLESADAGWRPVAENERFLGVYRFHILD